MIIDFHTHLFPDKIARATVDALAKRGGIKAYSDGTLDGLLSALSDAGVDIAVNLPVLTKPSHFESVLSFAKGLCEREYNGPRIISFAGAHPDMENAEEKLKSVKDAGFLGIKLHPDYQGTFFDDPRYVKIIECAKSLDLIVLTHAGFDFAYPGEPIKCTPKRVLRLLDKIGGYSKLVLAHIGGNELADEVYAELAGEDVYFDTAYSLHGVSEGMFKKILFKHGDERILFATDSPWRNVKEEVGIIKGYALGEEAERRIFSENAIKLLGI